MTFRNYINICLVLSVNLVYAQSDTVERMPFYEMTNSGVRIVEFFQEDLSFIVISKENNTVLDNSCIADQSCDTIWVSKSELYAPKYQEDPQIKSTCNYRGDEKNGKEYLFYSVHELRNVTITGWNFRLKCCGKWKHGKKHGKWHFFSPEGHLLRTEKWKNGTLVKTKTAD